jgi:ribosomal protein L11 methyltransferase
LDNETVRIWPALDISVGPVLDRIDLLQGALADYSVTAINEDATAWRVFFQSAAERDRAGNALRAAFTDLTLEAVDVPDDNWAARSQAALRAVRVGSVVVAPPWDVPDAPAAGDTIVVIKPSMGFGTGHHATTRLCLAALQRLDLRGRSVIDVGTGSGVLAIAASLLGAEPVGAFDDDDDAVGSARENLALNPAARVAVDVGDLRATGRTASDIVLANLTGGLLVAAAPELRHLTKPAGRLILSGFLRVEEADVRRAFSPLTIEHRDEEEDWLCVTLR